ncbi:MAG: hypothetical protein AVO33_04605 [delta proteobacterium ML8_F1]|nr:MAG: hypothetical protein AVO33_04605 [delta proteobacterium ML8_F1]
MIEIRNLSISLGDFSLKDISFEVKEGEFYILFGPTGAGKSVVMETIAGMLVPDKGRIVIGGREVTRLKPEKRDIAICYQDYALFPHLTVEENIRYGVKYKDPGPEFFPRLVALLGIGPLLKRYPENLSGGEKQRVSLARALMVRPGVFLLDEPLAALDSHIKDRLMRDIKQLHKEFHMTTIMITHSFQEAFFLGDRGSVIHEGRIQQTGTMEEIFLYPNSPFVADFVGLKNVFKAEVFHHLHADTPYIGIRPENIRLHKKKTPASISGVVTDISDMGSYFEIVIAADMGRVTAMTMLGGYVREHFKIGDQVYFTFSARDIQRIPDYSD